MLSLKKTWLYPAIAGIALLASACANNAAPNNTHPNKATTNQAAPHVTNFDGLHVRNYDGTRRTDFDGVHTRSYNGMHQTGVDGVRTGAYDGLHVRNGIGISSAPGVRDGMYPHVNNYNTYANGVRPYHAFTDGTGTAGTGTTGTGITGTGITGTGTAGTLSTVPGTTGTRHSVYQKHAWNRGGAGVMQTSAPKMGYVQTNRQQLHTASANHVYVDRDALAQAVGNVTASCPGVQRSTVLVTDEEIFVGLNTQGGDARTAKHQAKMNAMSVSPRYYKVYVTDNQNDIQEISRVASRSSNVHSARTEDTASVDALIKRMGGMTDGEQARTKSHVQAPSKSTKTHMGTTSR
ncbi:YhcN/YlaJ family sporulation lipoprotein [Brevibacillus sp. SIMBA_040]|uniref:YhcN/YlaJ family sporulation lipoprotein n=1 Tax=unclassified Brevibacillus TaxID=2684853 RepID=UPI00397D60A9